MPGKKTPSGELATKLCNQFKGASNYALAKKLKEQAPWMTKNAAGLAIRRARGKQGEYCRKIGQTTSERSRPSATKPHCPPSAAEPWLPVQIDGPSKILSLSDIHVPYHSKEAVEAAVKFGRKLKPDVVVLNGDTMDFYCGSRYQHDPRKRTFTEEIYTGREMLAWIRSQFRKTRIIYKLGNHDERWNTFIWNRAPEFFDLDNVQLRDVLKFEELGIEEVGDNAIVAGSLPVLHGHEIGKGIFSPVNPARGAFLRTNHTVLIGHLHRSSSHAESDMWHSETMTWSQGCLSDLTPEYARINRWNHGFAHIDVAADNQFNVHNYRLSSDFEVRTA